MSEDLTHGLVQCLRFWLQLKPKDVLEKYNEEIDGEKQTSFALGLLTSCFVRVVIMSRSNNVFCW